MRAEIVCLRCRLSPQGSCSLSSFTARFLAYKLAPADSSLRSSALHDVFGVCSMVFLVVLALIAQRRVGFDIVILDAHGLAHMAKRGVEWQEEDTSTRTSENQWH